jgi:hypothetical protein
MAVGAGIESGFDPIRPRAEGFGDDATVIQWLQLLNEKNCDER